VQYRRHFACRRKDRTRHAREYLQGLFHECKSNVERMVERIPESNYQQLQHFISDSEWDAKAVMKDVAENTNLSLESVAGEKGLIIGRKRKRESGRKERWSSSPIHRERRESVQLAKWSLCRLKSGE